MTQIDFYILGDNSHRDINQMVCRLCEKAQAQKMPVLIYTQSASQAQQLDDLLWTYSPDSFIAHTNRLSEPLSEKQDSSFVYPVQISSEFTTEDHSAEKVQQQLLINLTTETPPFFQQFKRLAELVDRNEEEKASARNRYRSYRQQGYTLNKYDL